MASLCDGSTLTTLPYKCIQALDMSMVQADNANLGHGYKFAPSFLFAGSEKYCR